ncbi:unnamed protein product [Ostreobium quekettii]|uniref:Glucose-6-phosphate isomerase n=1 Tax=Ostreobium quekettii TaxID=121088 RepID=A0A8S1IVZ3_9CHLO|nr:unnamed protein product [Ostreobium quekettii]
MGAAGLPRILPPLAALLLLCINGPIFALCQNGDGPGSGAGTGGGEPATLTDFYSRLGPDAFSVDYRAAAPDVDEALGSLTALDGRRLGAIRSRYVPIKGRVLLRTLREATGGNAPRDDVVIQSNIGPGEVAIVPPAYLHSTINPTCQETELLTFYPEGDPGLFTAQQLYLLSAPEIRAVTGQNESEIANRRGGLGAGPPVFLPFDCTSEGGDLPYDCECSGPNPCG